MSSDVSTLSVADEASARTLRSALERALHSGHHAVPRLVHADTTVAFRTVDGDSVVLLLDRLPCEVTTGDPPGIEVEVEIELTAAQAGAFAVGALPLTAAIVGGEVVARGPVRKYLEVDAILRTLLGQDAHGIGFDGRADAPEQRISGSMDAELLAIETRDLHKSFGPNHILTGLNLAIPEGVISVILGPSGTGKSVCLQHVIGIMRPDAGDVLIRGRPLSAMSRTEVFGLRREIGVMFQDGALFSAMNVYENVAFPLRQHTDYGEDEIHQAVTEHLASVGLGAAATRMPNELSGGMRKRAGLARALALNPGIVLCDEPDSGLDPVRTALLGDLLVERHAEHGGTMVVVTHNIMLARRIADHISVVWRGKVLESGMTEQILQSDTPFIEQFLSGAAHGPLTMDA